MLSGAIFDPPRSDLHFQSLLRRLPTAGRHELPGVGRCVDVGGGAILAHDVLSHGSEMRDFLDAIENHPDLETRIERRSRAGISVSVKGR